MYDAIVIGGGFYGVSIAHYLRTRRGLGRVLVLEREGALLTRSSFVNQARVHGGYHYLRSFTTAYRSRINMPRFCAEFGDAVFDSYASIYAIARANSKVTPQQMERFCAHVGAPLEPAPAEIAALFNPKLIERAYLTVEHAFDADKLRTLMERRLRAAGVEIRLGAEVADIAEQDGGVTVRGNGFAETAATVFNCTYSRLQRTAGRTTATDFRLRHEIAELVLVEPPAAIRDVGVTVMDGPFFSCMPFPARGLHSLTHVRYTPHLSWAEDPAIDPYARLDAYPRGSGVDWMIRDAARYMPCIAECRPVSTLFEVKTVLLKSEGDDGRPILFERHGRSGRLFSILGGKIDNIYDMLEQLDREPLGDERQAA